jgi:predicted SnoaL-like aldol condensation-catalyzing enzyme
MKHRARPLVHFCRTTALSMREHAMINFNPTNMRSSRRLTLALATGLAAIGLGLGTRARAAAARAEIERIYELWDEALGRKDLEAALALYTDDASIESPLVQHLLKTEKGIVQGKDRLRTFIALVFQTSPPQRKRFRTGFFTDGRVVTWEYPRVSPDGDQMDLVEVMKIEDGLIKHHKVYWGWYALNVLAEK